MYSCHETRLSLHAAATAIQFLISELPPFSSSGGSSRSACPSPFHLAVAEHDQDIRRNPGHVGAQPLHCSSRRLGLTGQVLEACLCRVARVVRALEVLERHFPPGRVPRRESLVQHFERRSYAAPT